MPTIHYTSSIKTETDHSTLSLLVHHNILTDLSPHPTHRLSICLPSNISVFLANPKALVINLTGESNHENATSSELLNSQLAQHICQHLQMVTHTLQLWDTFELSQPKCSVTRSERDKIGPCVCRAGSS